MDELGFLFFFFFWVGFSKWRWSGPGIAVVKNCIILNGSKVSPGAHLENVIIDKDARIEDYDTIFVGFPIWWYVAPTIINTFLECYDFSGKKIVLFATSGGSGFGKTVEELKNSVSGTAQLVEGGLLNGKQTYQSVSAWVDSLNL